MYVTSAPNDCFLLDPNSSQCKLILEGLSLKDPFNHCFCQSICNYSHYSGIPTVIMSYSASMAYFHVCFNRKFNMVFITPCRCKSLGQKTEQFYVILRIYTTVYNQYVMYCFSLPVFPITVFLLGPSLYI